ncbi:MAG: hypothetical protein AAFV95_24740 [Bacteroidota bacterium]
MAKARRTTTRSTRKKSTKPVLRTAAVAEATEKSTIKFVINALIFPEEGQTDTTDIVGVITKNSETQKETIDFTVEGVPPKFNLKRVMDAFEVESEELKEAVDGTLTLEKFEAHKTKTGTEVDSKLDFELSFTPSQTFILNKYPKLLELKRASLAMTKEKKYDVPPAS